MEFFRGEALSGFPFGLVNKSTGDIIITGTVNVFLTIDDGIQFAATHIPTYKGNGQWTVNFNGNETDGNLIGIMIVHADAIPLHFAFKTSERDANVPAIVVNISSAGTSIVDDFEYYGTLTAADLYFDNRLFSDVWVNATIKDRQTALIAAARAIDKLNYCNDKNSEDQNLQFPRGNDTTIPVEIEYAAYEIAIKFLEGVENEIEAQSLGVMSESYSGVKTSYQGSYVNEHLRAGIPSIEAWEYLKAFLRDSRQVNLSRVN